MIEPWYKHPFERVDEGEEYYYIDVFNGNFKGIKYEEDYFDSDNEKFESGNYYNNKKIAEQVAMDLNLQQRLRNFTYENGWSDELL